MFSRAKTRIRAIFENFRLILKLVEKHFESIKDKNNKVVNKSRPMLLFLLKYDNIP